MNWELIFKALSYLGTFLSGGWIINFYNARVDRTHKEIEATEKAMAVQEKLIKALDKRVDGLSREVRLLHKRVDLKHEVIYSAYGCKLFTTPDDCIVIKQYHQKCLDCNLNEAVGEDID